MATIPDTASPPHTAEPELIADYACVVGEGPLWHPREQRLYWIDIATGRIFRYDPQTDQSPPHEQGYQGDVIGGFTIQDNGALLLFMAKGAIKRWRYGQSEPTPIVNEIPEERATRFNDVIADPVGRVLCGTMGTQSRSGRLYRLDLDGTLTELFDGVGVSNGMGFSPDRQYLYYTDSAKRTIYRFHYDTDTGAITNRKDDAVFIQTPEGEGVPDGLTVDAEGYIWSARWDGGCLVRYTPEGVEDFRIAFPAKKVSSVTFGGKAYRDIYVTTAGGDKKDQEGTGAGALFRLRLGIQGKPEFLSKIKTRSS
jgi:D-xylonolactonase